MGVEEERHGVAKKTGGGNGWGVSESTKSSQNRRSAAAMFVGSAHAMNCSIKIRTKMQGAQRAEVKGAARWAAWASCPMELWTDSEQVVEGLNAIRDKGCHGRKNTRTCDTRYKETWK